MPSYADGWSMRRPTTRAMSHRASRSRSDAHSLQLRDGRACRPGHAECTTVRGALLTRGGGCPVSNYSAVEGTQEAPEDPEGKLSLDDPRRASAMITWAMGARPVVAD